MMRYLGLTGTTGRILARVARTGTTLLRTRTTTLARASSVTAFLLRFFNATACRADFIVICGQPELSSFGEYFKRFDITLSSKKRKAESAHYG
jgi:hypothetical protein